MPLFNFWGNYNKPGPGVEKDEAPKPAPIRFFILYGRKFSKLMQANLIFMLPVLVAAGLMFALYLAPYHFAVTYLSAGEVVSLDGWAFYVVPIPLILLAPFTAGLVLIARNFAREEHAFIWSDFWEAVGKNWKLFLLNGLVLYAVWVVFSFALVYYYNKIPESRFYLLPFWFVVLLSVMFLFMQYYIPIMFVTFDLTFTQVYRNAAIFIFAGLGRNLLITVILALVLVLLFGVVPIMPLTVLALLVVTALFLFSFMAFLINFTVYPVIDRYMIQPLEKQQEEARRAETEPPKSEVELRYPELFVREKPQQDEDDPDKMVYVNGRLIKKSQLKDDEE